jgi:hypothetical protein
LELLNFFKKPKIKNVTFLKQVLLFLSGMIAQRNESDGRILLGDKKRRQGGYAVLQFGFQLDFTVRVYTHIYGYMNTQFRLV